MQNSQNSKFHQISLVEIQITKRELRLSHRLKFEFWSSVGNGEILNSKSEEIQDIMELSFDRGISAVNALKDEYDALSVEFVKKQSREENLKQFISEKENKIVDLKREYVQLDEKLISTERQVESIEATIQHYREIKRYFFNYDHWINDLRLE